MNLGKYDQRIQFITEGQVSDGAGGYVPTPVSVLSTWARIQQLKASGDIEQAQLNLPQTYRVGVQVRAGFTPTSKHLLNWRGEKYTIISGPVVENVRYNQEWVFDIKKDDGKSH